MMDMTPASFAKAAFEYMRCKVMRANTLLGVLLGEKEHPFSSCSSLLIEVMYGYTQDYY